MIIRSSMYYHWIVIQVIKEVAIPHPRIDSEDLKVTLNYYNDKPETAINAVSFYIYDFSYLYTTMMKFFTLLFIFVSFFGFSQNKGELLNNYENHFGQMEKNYENKKEDSLLFHCRKAIFYAKELKDPALEGKVYIYVGSYYYDQNESSSLAYENYHRAYELYSKAKDTLRIAKTLFRMAILEKNVQNHTKAKESLFRSLELLKEQKPDFLHGIYNDLGIIYDHLGNLNQSILYYKKSLALRLESGNKELTIQSLNNIATTYKDHKDYRNAEKYFVQAFKHPQSELEKYPEEYARIIDNRAHLHFLQNKNSEVLAEYSKALKLRESVQNHEGAVMSHLHLAEYYRYHHDYKMSDAFAEKAFKSSYQMGTFRNSLLALKILRDNAESSGNSSKALDYGNQYIQLQQKVYDKEMQTEEKFADIRYASGQKEKENKSLRLQNKEQQLLTEKRKKYLYIAIGLFGVIALAGTGYIQYSRMEQKQKEQNAEKEIMELLIRQQEVSEKAKYLEQERISNDLHDSIAGKLSGLMLKLDTIAVSSPLEIKKKLDPAVENVDAILQELHSIVHDMNEQQVTEVSYPLLIRELAGSQLTEKTAFSFFIDESINWDTISNRIKLAFYYIIQQGVRNITEHSEATKSIIEIRSKENTVFLTISDNGIGMDNATTGMGLPGMKKRTEELGGIVELQSVRNKGTTITIKIPIT
ncbi:tetratricopeptide repeat-containing sensor histidine kinase [Chryseobacterium limigenitum]|uniref:histidine kinase n=1 Tax=Chryseobacterium limigenitum TaxID=1612149 RepID=A0A1K2IU30_9FLAO|nr:tetratricopeptide repeat protein [Chryseobacterium limigenitum]SFZ95243.1 Histidine kinase-, DNA gyrase B-, and HSP90-like ATPase [Chryseobacterium limigenitum]